jgi:hypothetical protein
MASDLKPQPLHATLRRPCVDGGFFHRTISKLMRCEAFDSVLFLFDDFSRTV